MILAGIRRFRGNCGFFFFILVLFVSAWSPTLADLRQGGADIGPTKLTLQKAEEFLSVFRRSRIETDYCAHFFLTHLPKKGPEIVYQGTIWGTWIGTGPCVRVRLEANPNIPESQPIEMILMSGLNPQSWIRTGTGAVEKISEQQMYKPLAPPLTYRPFDLQMPFLYWPTYTYEGAKKLKGRPTQIYIMKNTSGVGPYFGVKTYIDSGFKCLLRAEYLDAQNEKVSTLEVLDFKKYGAQWMVQTVDLIDDTQRNKTRLSLRGFAPMQFSDTSLFQPEGLFKMAPVPTMESNH
jgi:hypothetical protein